MTRSTPGFKAITAVSPEKVKVHDILSAGRMLVDFFSEFAQRPEEFIIYDDGYRRWSYTYRQLGAAARTFAAQLRAKAIAKGEKVLIWSENRPEWLAAFWGCLLEGVVAVPVDCRTSANVVLNLQRVVHACAILVGSEVKAAALEGSIPLWRLQDIELAGEERRTDSVREIGPDDVAEIVFTSGSTAIPKGVIITHRNIVADLNPIAREVERSAARAPCRAP
jgi:long-chain acyl-CoA synthetase